MLQEAFIQLFTGEKIVWMNLANAVEIAGYAIVIALLVSIPFGLLIGIERFPGKRLLLFLVHLWMYVPAVGLGIFLYYQSTGEFISPIGLILWSAILIIPLMTGLIADILLERDQRVDEEIYALGASKLQMYFTQMNEKRTAIYGAISGGFARIFIEIGSFYLVLSFLFGQGFPSKPVFNLSGASAHLAVALGLFLIGGIIYLGIHFLQFYRRRL
ncbi:MAG: ABC transporter permease subunit [Candidatus Marinimicrobia bacterium]|nr:ABC transporter permease subunit [Candidatus Neomarinimicrobiota bacterium]MCF7828140.1 ABC transporter permease subunit [Candidatus Neomarinimicrobiota bacterium]MCF7879685.1 ABC transporter permease subunit [Candidatus Neomarinimicrobiota bacterium]